MLTASQRIVLATIALHEPITLRGLATVLGQERNAVAACVAELVGAGLVQRVRSTTEAQVQLQPTATGRAVLTTPAS